MASVLLDPAYRRVSVEEFLQMDFQGARAELEDGVIRMMSGGSEQHARVAVNLIMALGPRLRGSGCRPYSSDFATRTEERTIRFPDVSVYCGNPSTPGNEMRQLLGDPRVIFEVLSPSTALLDQKVKLPEYREMPGVEAIVLIDPDTERVRLVERTGPEGWTDNWLAKGADLPLRCLSLDIPAAEIFDRD